MLILNLDHFQADAQITNSQNIEGGYVSYNSYTQSLFFPQFLRSARVNLNINSIADGPNITDVDTTAFSITTKTQYNVFSALGFSLTALAM